jgi:putative flippase GtrA
MRRFDIAATLDWRRLSRSATVGAIGTIFFYVLLWAFVERAHVGVLVATSLTFLIVASENYLLHYYWTFASRGSHATTFPQFLLMNAVGFAINWLVMFAGVGHLHLNYFLVQTVAIAAIVTWNHVVSHFWIFRHDWRPVTEGERAS